MLLIVSTIVVVNNKILINNQNTMLDDRFQTLFIIFVKQITIYVDLSRYFDKLFCKQKGRK